MTTTTTQPIERAIAHAMFDVYAKYRLNKDDTMSPDGLSLEEHRLYRRLVDTDDVLVTLSPEENQMFYDVALALGDYRKEAKRLSSGVTDEGLTLEELSLVSVLRANNGHPSTVLTLDKPNILALESVMYDPGSLEDYLAGVKLNRLVQHGPENTAELERFKSFYAKQRRNPVTLLASTEMVNYGVAVLEAGLKQLRAGAPDEDQEKALEKVLRVLKKAGGTSMVFK